MAQSRMNDSAAAHAVERLGIRPTEVVFRKVEMFDGVAVFRVRQHVGPRVFWRAVPIRESKREPAKLVGFLYLDGSLRNDAEILCKVGIGKVFGGIELPQFVVFWAPGIKPRIHNEHGWSRLRQRPMILLK